MTTANQTTSTTGSESCNTIGKQIKPRTVFVGGKSFVFWGNCAEFQTVAEAGWVLITSVGAENLYFDFKTDTGEVLPGFCKCL